MNAISIVGVLICDIEVQTTYNVFQKLKIPEYDGIESPKMYFNWDEAMTKLAEAINPATNGSGSSY